MASSRTPVPTVSARALLPIVGFASRLCPEASSLWQQVGLEPSVAANPDERYPLTKLLELQKVMTDVEAAQLAGKLKAEVAVPFHYRFHGNWFTETFILSHEGTPERFAQEAKTVAPSTQVRQMEPGERLVIKRG